LSNLYKYQEKSRFKSEFQEFEGIIRGVDNYGYLLVEVADKIEKFYFKEIEFLE